MGCMTNVVNGAVEDRLSEMPDEIIVHILSFMSTLDAVRTMLLCRFGRLWTSVPALRFDFDEYHRRMSDDFRIIDAQSSFRGAFLSFSRFVHNVLMRHIRPTIDSFHLYIYELDDCFDDLEMIDGVQTWLRFATGKGVKNLSFAFNGRDDLAPPRCVFTSQSIVTLALGGCMIEEYEDVGPLHMGALRKLTLTCVNGSNDAFNQLISGCPLLEELILDRPQGLRFLNITIPSVNKLFLDLDDDDDDLVTLHCPNVKTLDIAISMQSPSFRLWVTDVTALQAVNVINLPYQHSYGLVKSIMKHFQNVKDVSLSRKAFKQLSSMKKVNFPRNSWKRLVLQPWWDHERCVQVILKLVKSSVKLEELIIYAERSSDKLSSSFQKPILYSELYRSCVFPLLKTVTIHGYEKCCMRLVKLVEVLLRNAVALEKLVMTCGLKQLTTVEELDFVKQVSNFKRASTNATIVFA